ncbi:hypothetical protein EUTSA_v10011951mg [Eutrema salsugineum]|uniref:Uncharacterized protein n=1 Tax=Eutrema salsugineum TaxID=72664 RepID=V4KFJ3_EUTSA|nr:hypothetical protein EUTSA_v10011951mg [Eutrema salsugineum]
MGSFVGHVLPGFAFLALGLWHLFNNIKLFCLHPNTFTSSPWFPIIKLRHLELYLIMFSSSASISMELFIGPSRHHPFDSDGTIPAAASEGLTILAAAAAFTQELLLFHFHSTDHMGFEGQYHLILQLIIFVSLLTTLMGIYCSETLKKI